MSAAGSIAGATARRPLQRLLAESTAFAEPFMAPVALIGVIGHPLFYVIWTTVFPQPFEDLRLRLAGSAVCLPLVFWHRWPRRARAWLPLYWHFAVMFTLPFFFTLYMLLNAYALPWELTFIGGAFLLTFLLHWVFALAAFVLGTAAAFALGAAVTDAPLWIHGSTEIFVVYLFVLCVGSVVNLKLQRHRDAQARLERQLRAVSGQNAVLLRERNRLLGHFLNNTIIARLQRYEAEAGLDTALARITRQQRRFCAMMQADIRNFTKMFSGENELEVAALVAQCFSEITSIGQDVAVIKPVGDCIFLYSDIDQTREDAVLNVFALACIFVESVERVNQTLGTAGPGALNFGIALHAGEVIYGNLASDTLIDPTVIGVHVNQTARMEELTKSPVVRERVGVNAVVLSEEFHWQLRKAGRALPELVALDLAALGVSVRDFAAVQRVHALPREAALRYCTMAREWIRHARLRAVPGDPHIEHSRYRDVEYHYEMHGTGPNVIWSIFVDVSAYPDERVEHVVRSRFAALRTESRAGGERWLKLSTEDAPGEYDESDVERCVIEIIDALAATGGDARRSSRN